MSDIKRYLLTLAAFAVVVGVISAATRWPLSNVAWTLLIGWPSLEILISIDDNLPGGWNIPEDHVIPEWLTLKFCADVVCCRGGMVIAAYAFERRHSPSLLGFVSAAAVMACLGVAHLAWTSRKRAADVRR